MHHDLSNIEKLQIEILMEIFSYLKPEDIANQKKVSKTFFKAAAAPLLWQKKFKLHFPHRIKKIPKSAHIDWYDLFVKTYKQEYKFLDPKGSKFERKFFSLIKEGDLEGLKGMSLNAKQLFHYLSRQDIHNTYAYEWLHQSKNSSQALLDFIYKICSHPDNRQFFSEHSISPLHWAILCNQREQTIKDLLDSGCDINELSPFYFDSPIVLASKCGLDNIVKLLIEKGATIEDSDSSLPLIAAIKNGNFNVVKTLLESKSLDLKKDLPEGSYLHIAVKSGNLDIVTQLLEDGADPNKTTSDDQISPLHLAAKAGHCDIVEKLLDKGADPKTLTDMTETALHLAARAGHSDVIRKLLDRASIDVKNKITQYTPLHEASENGRIEAVITLLKAGANTENLTMHNKTASQLAVDKGHQNIARAIEIYKLIQELEDKVFIQQSQKRRKTESDETNELSQLLDSAEKNIAKTDVQEEIIQKLKLVKNRIMNEPHLFFALKNEEPVKELKHKEHDEDDFKMPK